MIVTNIHHVMESAGPTGSLCWQRLSVNAFKGSKITSWRWRLKKVVSTIQYNTI